MYVKRPVGKIWHVIGDPRGGRSVCGALRLRPAFVALYASEGRAQALPLCKHCERASERARRGPRVSRAEAPL